MVMSSFFRIRSMSAAVILCACSISWLSLMSKDKASDSLVSTGMSLTLPARDRSITSSPLWAMPMYLDWFALKSLPVTIMSLSLISAYKDTSYP